MKVLEREARVLFEMETQKLKKMKWNMNRSRDCGL